MSVLDFLNKSLQNRGDNSSARFSTSPIKMEEMVDLAKTEVGDDEVKQQEWLTSKIITVSKSQWGRANRKISQVEECVPARNGGKGYVLYLKGGLQLWSETPARIGDSAHYYIIPVGHFIANWNTSTETIDGYRVVKTTAPQLLSVQELSRVEFEVEVRKQVSGVTTTNAPEKMEETKTAFDF